MDYYYDFFGFKLKSAFPLHGYEHDYNENEQYFPIMAVDELEHPDIAKSLVKPFSHLSPKHYYLKIHGVAEYLLLKDEGIFVKVDDKLRTDHSVGLFLEETVLPIYLQMNDVFLFEASAVQDETGISLFCGPANDGKSTLASGLVMKGRNFIADDKCMVYRNSDGNWVTKPFLKNVNVWSDILHMMKKTTFEAPVKLRDGIAKFSLNVKEESLGKEMQIKDIFLLNVINEQSVQVEVKPVSGISKLQILKGYTHLFNLTASLDKSREHFNFISQISKDINVNVITRGKESLLMDLINIIIDEY